MLKINNRDIDLSRHSLRILPFDYITNDNIQKNTQHFHFFTSEIFENQSLWGDFD